MNDSLKGRDYISTQDWSDAEIELALDTAAELKTQFKNGIPHRHLPDHRGRHRQGHCHEQ